MTTPFISFQLSASQIHLMHPSCGICKKDFQPDSILYGHSYETDSESLHVFHRRCLRQYFKSIAQQGTLTEESFHCFYCMKKFETVSLLFTDEHLQRLFATSLQARLNLFEEEVLELEREEVQQADRRRGWIGTTIGLGLGMGVVAGLTPSTQLAFRVALKAQCVLFGSSLVCIKLYPDLDQLHALLKQWIPLEIEDSADYFSVLMNLGCLLLSFEVFGERLGELLA